MPLLLISYALQFFDKTTLGYTAILGIQKDTVSLTCSFLLYRRLTASSSI